MELLFEEVAGGAHVSARIVLQGNRSVREIAQIKLTRSEWEDFARCLGPSRQARPGRWVFSPQPSKPSKLAKAPVLHSHLRIEPGYHLVTGLEVR